MSLKLLTRKIVSTSTGRPLDKPSEPRKVTSSSSGSRLLRKAQKAAAKAEAAAAAAAATEQESEEEDDDDSPKPVYEPVFEPVRKHKHKHKHPASHNPFHGTLPAAVAPAREGKPMVYNPYGAPAYTSTSGTASMSSGPSRAASLSSFNSSSFGSERALPLPVADPNEYLPEEMQQEEVLLQEMFRLERGAIGTGGTSEVLRVTPRAGKSRAAATTTTATTTTTAPVLAAEPAHRTTGETGTSGQPLENKGNTNVDGADPNSGSGADPNSGSGADPNSGSGADPNSGSGSGSGSDSAAAAALRPRLRQRLHLPPRTHTYAFKKLNLIYDETPAAYYRRCSKEYILARHLQDRGSAHIIGVYALCKAAGSTTLARGWGYVMELGACDLFSVIVRGGASSLSSGSSASATAAGLAAWRAVPSTERHCLFKQIAEGIRYMHSQGVAHRDLKPENVLLCPGGVCKLTDFGISCWTREVPGSLDPAVPFRTCKGMLGSPPYAPPEVMAWDSKKGYPASKQGPCDPRALDCYSLGVMLFTLAQGLVPFVESCDRDARFRDYCAGYDNFVRVQHPRFKERGGPSRHRAGPGQEYSYAKMFRDTGASRVAWRLADPDPRTRYTMDDLYEDPWFMGIEVCVEPLMREEVVEVARSATAPAPRSMIAIAQQPEPAPAPTQAQLETGASGKGGVAQDSNALAKPQLETIASGEVATAPPGIDATTSPGIDAIADNSTTELAPVFCRTVHRHLGGAHGSGSRSATRTTSYSTGRSALGHSALGSRSSLVTPSAGSLHAAAPR